jgi:hypothetical protein
MKKILLTLSSLLISTAAFAHGDGPGVSNAKAIELSAHRVDRLVALNKIDASFLKKMDTIEVIVVENQAPIFYKTRVSQTKPTQGNPIQLEISLDDDGKPLSYKLIPDGVAGPDLGWPDKTAGELTENALHYVLENAADAKIALFDKAATSFTLSKAVINKQSVAMGQITSSATTEKLNIYLNLDGTFISAEIVP